MANLATKAPDITPEIAREYQRRATASRLARIEREKAEERQKDIEARALFLSQQITPDPDEARKARTLKQVDKLDKLIDRALDDDDTDLFLKLTTAKARLWELVSPTAGTLKPRPANPRDRRPSVEPIPTPTPQQVVSAPQSSDPNG